MNLHRIHSSRRGSATVAALLTVVVLIGVTGAMLSLTIGVSRERNAAGARLRAFTAANSAVAHTIANMNEAEDPATAAVGQVVAVAVDPTLTLTKSVATTSDGWAMKADAVHFSSSYYWSNITNNGDGSYTITATGSSAGVTETVEVLVEEAPGGAFDNAVFAGNTDEDPLYVLDFGGTGGQADDIDGDVFSGGSVLVTGDADISGTVRARKSIVGWSGEQNVSQGILDLESMKYESTADFMVADLFDSATYQSDDAGGDAWQLPEESPAHIFRKNPSDRSANTNATEKDDYFLEDPYESVRADSNQNGSDAFHITFSGTGGDPGPVSNKKVFFIDGNLWLHNRKSYSLKIYEPSGDEGMQITFIVKGNVYMADNLFYKNKTKDGVAFIAMKDPDVEDSGNIYFGDPEFGTLKEMNAFMYAENNFYDYNLDESGSETVSLYGNMTAGNKVLIERDYGTSHTKLSVEFDDRICEGNLEMPGLPTVLYGGGGGFKVAGWRRASVN